ncbi:MAG: hypothetical protein ACFE8U_14135, partial [Candidatus Hermodarchaeota archaeon]
LKYYRTTIGKGTFVGTPDQVKKRFQEMISLGFDYFQIMFPYPIDYNQSTKFAQLVMSELK